MAWWMWCVCRSGSNKKRRVEKNGGKKYKNKKNRRRAPKRSCLLCSLGTRNNANARWRSSRAANPPPLARSLRFIVVRRHRNSNRRPPPIPWTCSYTAARTWSTHYSPIKRWVRNPGSWDTTLLKINKITNELFEFEVEKIKSQVPRGNNMTRKS